MLPNVVFHADSEYHVYFARKLSFGTQNLEIRVKMWYFAGILLVYRGFRPDPGHYLSIQWHIWIELEKLHLAAIVAIQFASVQNARNTENRAAMAGLTLFWSYIAIFDLLPAFFNQSNDIFG
jgi:hypothetical protein